MAFIKIIDGQFIAAESDLSPAKPNEIEQTRIENESLKARIAELEAAAAKAPEPKEPEAPKVPEPKAEAKTK